MARVLGTVAAGIEWLAVGVPILLYVGLIVALGGCLASAPTRDSVPSLERVRAFPSGPLALHAPAVIHWSAEQVPFIEAQDDRDVPYLLGMVHAHLRLGQMEVLKRIAQGRLSELGGPIVLTDIDHLLRTLGFARASSESLRMMRPDTRAWLEAYVAGINAYRELAPERSSDQRLLAIPEETWTPEDVLTLGRLASTDINWVTFWTVLNRRDDPAWREVWERLKADGASAVPSFGPQTPIDLVAGVSRSGSNSLVLAGARTASGSGMVVNDPHVGFILPALWVITGYKSPGLHALGLGIPGIPAVLLGRNERIAWGGTNMQGLSTSMYDVSGLSADQVRAERITIQRRFWIPARRTIRWTPHGPIVTDLDLFGGDRDHPVAWRWRGHEPSDELTAFYDMNRAGTFEEFRRAFEPYAVSGQNFLYADVHGNIGQVAAIEYQPATGRTALAPLGIGDPSNPAHRWGEAIKSTDLPFVYNPDEGFLASANNPPVRTDPPLTLTAQGNDRMLRFAELVKAGGKIDVPAAANIQTDVYSASSHELARAIAERAARITRLSNGAEDIAKRLAAWDGQFRARETGPVAFDAAAYHLVMTGYARMYGAEIAAGLLRSVATVGMLLEDVRSGRLDEDLASALNAASEDAPPEVTWGDRHVLRLSHLVGNIPLLGSSYVYGEIPVDGSLLTIFKSGHALSNEKHRTGWGATARHISDLGDMDENHFVIMGGQDGWPGSANFLDMLGAWRAGELIRVPMRIETVRRTFPVKSELTPGPAGGGGGPARAGEQGR